MTNETTPIFAPRADRWTRAVVLALTLTLSCVIGLITPYILAAIGIALWYATALRRALRRAYADRAASLFLLSFIGLAISFALTARQAGDMLFAVNFAPFLLYAPIRQLLANGAAPGNAVITARLALAGSALGLAVTLFALFVLNYPRADTPVLGAIVLSNTAVLLGFISLIGVLADRGRLKWIYLSGPWLGVGVALLTASRGPLVAVPPLAIVAAIFLARHLRLRRRQMLVVSALALLAIGLLAVGLQERFNSMLQAAADILSGAAVTDDTTRIRLVLYQAGFQAFLQSPWIGYGWSRLMTAIIPFLSPGDLQYAALPQLHNDVLNFAVAAGVFGVAIYVLLVAIPIVAAILSPRDDLHEVRVFGCVLLSVGYVFAGLTDLMFGFEFHTMLYVSLTAILLGYCSGSPTR